MVIIMSESSIKNDNCAVNSGEPKNVHRNILNALNEMDVILSSQKNKTFEESMGDALFPIAESADVDRILIYSYNENNKLGQIYRWSKAEGGTVALDKELTTLPDISVFKNWISLSAKGKSVNINLDTMTDDERTFLDTFNVKSLFFTPVFINDELWGTVAFQNHTVSRIFDQESVELLTHVSRLCANALIRFEKTESAKIAVERLKRREKALTAMNKAAVTIISHDTENFIEVMSKSLSYIAKPFRLDRISVWRNKQMEEGLGGSQIYRWDKDSGGTTEPNEQLQNITYKNFAPSWEKILESGKPLNGPVSLIPDSDALKSFGVVSAYIVPVIIKNVFWGFVLFEDRIRERHFKESYIEMLNSAAYLCANAVIRDETERELIETEANREANRRIHLMLNATPLACRLWSREFRIIDCNDESYRLFGLKSKREYIEKYRKLSPVKQPDGVNSTFRLVEYLTKAFEDGRFVFEWMHQTLDGTPIPVEITLVRIKYKDDFVIAGYTRDLRELKTLMSEIKTENEKIITMSHWYETILDSVPFGITVQDLNRRFTFFNSTAERVFEKTRKDMIGSECKSLGLEICETNDCAITCANKGQMRTHFNHHDSSYQADVGILKDMKGVKTGYIEIIQDITKMELMAKQQAEAEAASKAKSNFLSNMSHEMRTPMNAIIGMTVIGKDAKDIDQKNYALNKISEASSHLLGVINDILDMSKIEADMLDLSYVEFNFDRMLQKVMSVVNFRIDEKSQQLSVNVDSDIPRFIVGDDQRMAQVITNLLSNAIKFTHDEGKIRLEAFLVSEEADGTCEIRISVTDTGIGISEENQKKLFSAFVQAENGISREYGGTGLGLVISKRIIELMGGDITVASILGKGSVFTFTMKVKRGKQNPQSMLNEGVNWGNVRIMVVDDEPEILKQFVGIFEQLGIHCDVALNGHEACEKIEKNGFYDIYFIDFVMPGMNGIELTDKIKWHSDSLPSNGKPKPCVVIMITAMDWKQLREDASKAGVDKHLHKPLLSATIVDCVNECLGIRQLGTSIPSAPIDGEFENKNILIVEDVEINREIFIALLEKTGAVIDSAENGKEAVKIVSDNLKRYDIVFMDLQMPQMDGFEATRRIRALPSCAKGELPIVAMTANVFKEDIDACLAAGMDKHLGKPFDVYKLFEILRGYLKM
ncbi:MAG: response regulator [Oscillospiraceae bacterium]|nr:response regulator [Oscillospiraceae bacterium]